MGAIAQRIRSILESATGYRIERFGHNAITMVKTKHSDDAWFSPAIQLQSVIDEFDIDLVIDAGANEGQFGQHLRRFYRGEILSFEPVSATYGRLAAAAQDDPAWKTFNVALGSREETLTINLSRHSVFSSFLKPNVYCNKHFGEGSTVEGIENVAVRRLDEILCELVPDIGSRRIFLKMDTQGYDSEVFLGAGTLIESVVALQSEVSLIPVYENMPHWTDTVSLYEKSGFRISGMFPVNRDAKMVVEYDCLMVRDCKA